MGAAKNLVEENNSRGHKCIKCGSDDLEFTTNVRGFSFGKAAIGGLTLGIFGLLAGGIGAKKGKVMVRCNKCLTVFSGDRFAQEEKNKLREEEFQDKPISRSLMGGAILATVFTLVVKIFVTASFLTVFGCLWILFSIMMLGTVRRENLSRAKKIWVSVIVIIVGITISGVAQQTKPVIKPDAQSNSKEKKSKNH